MLEKNITFTVVIPYYKSINTIERTLLSVLYQDCRDYEIIVINDCSTDNPNDIIEDFTKRFKFLGINLKYIVLKKNSGPSFARNFAWNLAIGDYVCFLDSDDMWHPNKLSICKKYIIALQPQLLFHNSLISLTGKFKDLLEIDYTNSEFTVRNIIPINWLLKNLAVTPAVLVKKDINLRFNEKMKYCEDYDLWLRLRKQNKKFFNCKAILVKHRIHAASAFNAKGNNNKVDDLLIRHQLKSNCEREQERLLEERKKEREIKENKKIKTTESEPWPTR